MPQEISQEKRQDTSSEVEDESSYSTDMLGARRVVDHEARNILAKLMMDYPVFSFEGDWIVQPDSHLAAEGIEKSGLGIKEKTRVEPFDATSHEAAHGIERKPQRDTVISNPEDMLEQDTRGKEFWDRYDEVKENYDQVIEDLERNFPNSFSEIKSIVDRLDEIYTDEDTPSYVSERLVILNDAVDAAISYEVDGRSELLEEDFREEAVEEGLTENATSLGYILDGVRKEDRLKDDTNVEINVEDGLEDTRVEGGKAWWLVSHTAYKNWLEHGSRESYFKDREKDPELEIDVDIVEYGDENKDVEMVFRDNGPGIDETREKLVDWDEDDCGGFGYSIIDEVVDMYGGEWEINSGYEDGTELYVKMPMADEKYQPDDEEEAEEFNISYREFLGDLFAPVTDALDFLR